MSSMSRRSLLGYSGSAVAGAAFASAGTATAAGAEESPSASVEFDPGTKFSAQANASGSDLLMEMSFSVRVDRPNGVPTAQEITPLEIAEALSALAEAKGWPPITFYGTPPPVPLN